MALGKSKSVEELQEVINYFEQRLTTLEPDSEAHGDVSRSLILAKVRLDKLTS